MRFSFKRKGHDSKVKVQKEIDWGYVLSRLENLGNVSVEFPDGPTDKYYGLSSYFYRCNEMPDNEFVRNLRDLGFAIFKHAINVSSITGNGKDETTITELDEYFKGLPHNELGTEYPVKPKFYVVDVDGKDEIVITFLQHALMHVAGSWPYPNVRDTVFIYHQDKVDDFFEGLRKMAKERGYEPYKYEEAFIQYHKPHKDDGFQLPLIKPTPEMDNVMTEPLTGKKFVRYATTTQRIHENYKN